MAGSRRLSSAWSSRSSASGTLTIHGLEPPHALMSDLPASLGDGPQQNPPPAGRSAGSVRYRGPVLPANRANVRFLTAPAPLVASRLLLVAIVAMLWLVPAQSVLGHVERSVGSYTIVLGLIGEPFFQAPRSGFDFSITQAGRPVDGAEKTLTAQVSGGGTTRTLTLVARDQAGRYEAEFDAPVEARYAFRLGGSIEGQPVDLAIDFHLVPRDEAPVGDPSQPAAAGVPSGTLPLLPIAAIGGLLVVGVGFALVIAGRRATAA